MLSAREEVALLVGTRPELPEAVAGVGPVAAVLQRDLEAARRQGEGRGAALAHALPPGDVLEVRAAGGAGGEAHDAAAAGAGDGERDRPRRVVDEADRRV